MNTKHTCKICGIPVSHKPRRRGAGVVCSKQCLRESRRATALANVASGKGPPRNVMTQDQRDAARARMTGPGCPRWNGGRTTGGNGRYILVKCPESHPFTQSVDSRGYIREHRLVMECHIGRALTRKEVVHHINGDRHDNRIENLELFSSHGEHMAAHH